MTDYDYDPYPCIQVRVPVDTGDPSAICVTATLQLLAERDGAGVGTIVSFDTPVSWLAEFDYVLFVRDSEGPPVVVRTATDDERSFFRVPSWIQGPEVPICCGRRMVFVGQLDDYSLHEERPNDAELWWHDAASFYVFTCSVCMECKAVGQQY